MKKSNRKVMLVGAAMSGPERGDFSGYREFAAKPFFRALDDLKLTPEDMEIISVAYNERSIPDAAIAPIFSDALAGLKIPVIPVSCACTGGGMAAFNMYNYISSGMYDIGAVVSFSQTELFFPMETASAMGNFTDLDFALGLTHIQYSSLKESLYRQKFSPGDLNSAAKWALQDHWYGRRNPNAVHNSGPLPSQEQLMDTGNIGYRARSAAGRNQACTLIFASEDVAKKFDRPLYLDVALGFRSPYLGAHCNYPHPDHRDCDFSQQPGVTVAARQAMRRADIDLDEIDVFQVHDLTPYDGMMQLEALGLCKPGEMSKLVLEGVTAVDGKYPTNTDGGSIAFGHSSAGGDFPSRVIENMLQLRGEAGERQVADAKVALAHAYGTHQSIDSVAVLRRGY